MAPLENFSVFTDEDRLTATALYGERLAGWLMYMTLPTFNQWIARRSSNHFDLRNPKLDAWFEVKMANDKDGLVIYVDQLLSQVEELDAAFPQVTGIAWIFYYRNQGDAVPRINARNGTTYLHHPRLLKAESGKSWESVSRFLAENICRADVTLTTVIDRYRRKMGQRIHERYAKDHPDRPKHCRYKVNVTPTDLHRLTADPRTSFAKLGFPTREYRQWLMPNESHIAPREVVTEMDGNEIRFKLNPILPMEFRDPFLKQLNGNVHRILEN